jgi:hypothetical protein
MTDLNVHDAVAKADDMANPAFLAASMIEERAAAGPVRGGDTEHQTRGRNDPVVRA